MNTRRLASALLFASICAGTAVAQIDYELSFDLENEAWTVEGKLTNPERGDVDFWIPRWTAGAYHLAEFGASSRSSRPSARTARHWSSSGWATANG